MSLGTCSAKVRSNVLERDVVEDKYFDKVNTVGGGFQESGTPRSRREQERSEKEIVMSRGK